jgi:hypothetical protein
MKLHGTITINGRAYQPGSDVPWFAIYPFFLIHMAAFGITGFAAAYGGAPLDFVYMHGGIAILVYLIFYLAIFGRDEVEWMFINAGLGLFGIVSQIDWILSWFGKSVGDYPPSVHVIPFLYFILYTFLIRRAVLDLSGARDDPDKRRRVQIGYVAGSLGVYGGLALLGL